MFEKVLGFEKAGGRDSKAASNGKQKIKKTKKLKTKTKKKYSFYSLKKTNKKYDTVKRVFISL